MARHRVVCVDKRDHDDPWERITHLGGPTFGVMSADEMIRRIEGGADSYFTLVGGEEADIEVHLRKGNKYLKTRNDRDKPDNLLSLESCKSKPPIKPKEPRRYART